MCKDLPPVVPSCLTSDLPVVLTDTPGFAPESRSVVESYRFGRRERAERQLPSDIDWKKAVPDLPRVLTDAPDADDLSSGQRRAHPPRPLGSRLRAHLPFRRIPAVVVTG